MNTMGKRIYMKRTENGMTMKQLADRLGVQTSAINKYEKGEDMAKIFKCSPSWLMGFDADMDITLTLPMPKGRGVSRRHLVKIGFRTSL